MKHISVLIKPASSLCNMTCRYCFYADIVSHREVPSYGKMRPEITVKMIENIYFDLDDGDHLTIAFQGGEPTVAGLRYFKHLDEVVKKQEKKVTVCNDGCRRAKDAVTVNRNNDFCGYQTVLKKIVPKINNILDDVTAISESTF